ncbi:hypothetical protein Ahy_A06g028744 [Arachis hypogaea]|uniref:Protein FAR1-RELATED SEQUENCE n=1 Tax=Arachis hypogaea TaxID=3818 RepID=A0A445CRQ7_ARAHY|nr:hypothetical protein Ahy_A06g028744 [Arachis hypogaea]
MVEFIQHFNRCVDHIRWKEVQADLASVNGKPIIEECYQCLHPNNILYALTNPCMSCINEGNKYEVTSSYVIYSVDLDRTPNEMGRVFFCDIEMEFNCSCMRMESFGIPCEHIVSVLMHEDIDELSKSLVLPRWTKTANFRQLANIACQDNEKFIFTQETTMNLLKQFKEKDATQKELANDVDSARDNVQMNASGAGLGTNDIGHGMPNDPRICRTKESAA